MPVIGGKEFTMDYADNPPSLKLDLIIKSTLKGNNQQEKIDSVLVDTGADYLMLPDGVIQKLKLKSTGNTATLTSWDKKAAPVKVKFYEAVVEVVGVDEFIIEVVGVDGDPLIGRNLINELKLLMNGNAGKNGGVFEIATNSNFSLWYRNIVTFA